MHLKKKEKEIHNNRLTIFFCIYLLEQDTKKFTQKNEITHFFLNLTTFTIMYYAVLSVTVF